MFRIFGLIGVLLTVLIMSLMWARAADDLQGPLDCGDRDPTTTLPIEVSPAVAAIINDC